MLRYYAFTLFVVMPIIFGAITLGVNYWYADVINPAIQKCEQAGGVFTPRQEGSGKQQHTVLFCDVK